MNLKPSPSVDLSRRDFIGRSGRYAAASALAGVALPHVHAAHSDEIRVALIGCGGRGTGAATQALSTTSGPIRLTVMADVFAPRLATSLDRLSKHQQVGKQVDVPEERRFLGLDAYKAAMDALRPGDIVILATPPAFRWVHFSYAIAKRLNVFMEKPVTADGPTSKRMLALGEEAAAKNLKVGVGLMCRHCEGRGELAKRIQDGQLGEILLMRAYRMHGPIGFFQSPPKPEGISDLMYQVQRFHSFMWSGGGCYSDFYIHNIDECSWMKGAWPVKAQSVGGRHYRGDSVDQNFDSYSTEYTFADGTKLYMEGRCITGCVNDHSSTAHGTKGMAIISEKGHIPSKARIYRGHTLNPADVAWAFPQPEKNPYQLEWDHLVGAIRADRPYNEVKRGVEASLVTSMGRMSAHTGQVITFDQMLNCEHEFAPGLDTLTADSPAPLQPGPDGKYPVPRPGIETKREY
ncbi:MAG: Gfo/Idh/MocA family oxidoreductase [Opitutaceae bacterium]|nr:Gfo/Idh/MocA family oxidoreductase [Opitutaceae bacterium]